MQFNFIYISILIFISPFILVSQDPVSSDLDEKHIETSLRMVGHEVLLFLGDCNSPVKHIEKENDTYKITLGSDFSFNPEDLVATIDSVVLLTGIAEKYIIEISECTSDLVVYSYIMDHTSPSSIIPCTHRSQPKSCYYIYFTKIESASIDDNDLNEIKISTRMASILCLLSLSIITIFLYYRKRKIDPSITSTPITKDQRISIGSYLYDKKNRLLYFNETSSELTSKEADLLLLLLSSVNQTIQKEKILELVWGDEGDYVGRTLDVFISKLRKKLSQDSSIKIDNTRGVGYKLVI